jgi:hypothetical protein
VVGPVRWVCHCIGLRPMALDPTTLFVVVFGVRIAIRLDDPSIGGRIAACLPPQWCLCSPAKIDRVYRFSRIESGSWALFGDDIRLGRTDALEAVCDRFQNDLVQFVAVHARTHALVHAGVVGWQERAIVIPNHRFSGKTSLVAELIHLGAEYYSDEYALIDVKGRVWPFPRPSAMHTASAAREVRHVDDGGAIVGRKPLPIGWVVVADSGSEEQGRPLSEPTKEQAVLALFSNAAAARTQSAFLLRTCRAAVRDAITLSAPGLNTATRAFHLLSACVTTAAWSADLHA